MAGPVGGLVALALYAFSPDVIAHGSLATLDVPAAGFLLTSTWLLWRARRRPLLYLPLAGAGARRRPGHEDEHAGGGRRCCCSWSCCRSGTPAGRRPAPATGRQRGGSRSASRPPSAWPWSRSPWCGPATSPSTRACAGRRPGPAGAAAGCAALVVDWLPFPQPYRDGMRVQFGFENRVWGGFLFGQRVPGLALVLPAGRPAGEDPARALLALWLAGAVAMVAVPRLRAGRPVRARSPRPCCCVVAMNESPQLRRPVRDLRADLPGGRRRGRGRRPVAMGTRGGGGAGRCSSRSARCGRSRTTCRTPTRRSAGRPATHRHLHDSNVDWGQDLGRLADAPAGAVPRRAGLAGLQGQRRAGLYGIVAARPAQGAAGARSAGCSSCRTPGSPGPTAGSRRWSPPAGRSTRSATRSRSTAGD